MVHRRHHGPEREKQLASAANQVWPCTPHHLKKAEGSPCPLTDTNVLSFSPSCHWRSGQSLKSLPYRPRSLHPSSPVPSKPFGSVRSLSHLSGALLSLLRAGALPTPTLPLGHGTWPSCKKPVCYRSPG